jgi:hypothetical protein
MVPTDEAGSREGTSGLAPIGPYEAHGKHRDRYASAGDVTESRAPLRGIVLLTRCCGRNELQTTPNVENEVDESPRPSSPKRKILLAADFSPISEVAWPHAVVLASHFGCDLYLGHVIDLAPMDFLPAEDTARKLQHTRSLTEQKLEPLLEAARKKGVPCRPFRPAKRLRFDSLRWGECSPSRPSASRAPTPHP